MTLQTLQFPVCDTDSFIHIDYSDFEAHFLVYFLFYTNFHFLVFLKDLYNVKHVSDVEKI